MGNCYHLNNGQRKKDDDLMTRLQSKEIEAEILNQLTDSKPLDQRRLVYVSLIGLYQTYHLCPASRLYSAIFVLPLKKEWIYDPKIFQQETKTHIFGHHDLTTFNDKSRINQFLELLQWKQSQNLLFCMLDNYEVHKKDKSQLVAAFWIYFNQQLCDLCDVCTQKKYKPLTFDAEYWRFAYESSIGSNFKTQGHKLILNELYFITNQFNFKALQTIIYQSNPRSLNPIVAYDPHKMDCILSKSCAGFVSLHRKRTFAGDEGFVCFTKGCCPDIEDSDNDDDEGIWMISTAYNEYDLD